ncbi:helix-turn-helix domain-containing protein [Paenibacillus sp. LMG 31461]|uniref:Helix-turn-helix domain-containing protein n=1 Tax=Paenibacillus plantarum TaxID=2654975 RepID=A0ABX1X6R2_9BACL|nr:AraC family transcriptional regulator [Paenibacillus plantarum]NOU63992.1 helix-turn-helix domain-containing protein [Paenibacillus plantarum]
MEYFGINPQIELFSNRHSTPNWIIEDATTDFYDLTYIFKGRAYYCINGNVYEVNQGDLLCIPKGSRRSATTDSANLMTSYALNIQLYDKEGKDVNLPFPLISHIGEPEELHSLYNELTFEWLKKNKGHEMKARALLLMILHYYFKALYYKDNNENIDKRIQRSIRYILSNLQNQIEVEVLASIAGLTTAYFGTLFKKYMGASVKEYINRMKINNAENILLSGEFTVQEAAYKCGFEDIYYFSKVFKKIKGFPPSRILIENSRSDRQEFETLSNRILIG